MNTRHTAAVTVLLAAAVVPVANAVIINVPGDQPTIQAGIIAAMNGDEVVVAPGTYLETIDFLGKAITLRSSDGAEVTIIDGTGSLHVVQCVSGEGPDTVLDGFAITGGNADGAVFNGVGGGMLNRLNSSPTVTNCTFSGNSAFVGGEMMNSDNSSPMVINCLFNSNTATGTAGGMYNDGSSPTVTNCTFSGNTATSAAGGMYNSFSDPTLTNCTFSGNSAGAGGGGIFNFFGSSPTVTNCTFSGNSAGAGGGGMVNDSGSSPTVTDCSFCGNSPDHVAPDLSGLSGQIQMTTFCPIPVCPGDITGDGNVGITDFLELLANWGPCP